MCVTDEVIMYVLIYFAMHMPRLTFMWTCGVIFSYFFRAHD